MPTKINGGGGFWLRKFSGKFFRAKGGACGHFWAGMCAHGTHKPQVPMRGCARRPRPPRPSTTRRGSGWLSHRVRGGRPSCDRHHVPPGPGSPLSIPARSSRHRRAEPAPHPSLAQPGHRHPEHGRGREAWRTGQAVPNPSRPRTAPSRLHGHVARLAPVSCTTGRLRAVQGLLFARR